MLSTIPVRSPMMVVSRRLAATVLAPHHNCRYLSSVNPGTNTDNSSDSKSGNENENVVVDDFVPTSFTRKLSPTERRAAIHSMIRVNHAGELGAVQICKGQLAVLTDPHSRAVVQSILDQEKVHLSTFEGIIQDRRVRPTIFNPLWHKLAYGIGMATSLLGKEVAMACHSAVETVIAEHYNDQIREIHENGIAEEREFKETIKKFRDEEVEHYHKGIENNAEQAPLYEVINTVIQGGCRGAIWLSKRF